MLRSRSASSRRRIFPDAVRDSAPFRGSNYRWAVIPSAPFGSTGHQSRRTLFGAAALSRVTQAEADRALELLLQHDIDHLDTAASYGEAELRVRPWLRAAPDQFFIATKTDERNGTIIDVAEAELVRSGMNLKPAV